ncbi:NfeD family protein [Microvirga massiliensis]|uniref:NfeD family protein n=1 Tax=Microvirga massiliensis TaxID=1033741 RepID=UPI000A776C93|nr:nodulation protein NfeD [Microvirga massiliensis]
MHPPRRSLIVAAALVLAALFAGASVSAREDGEGRFAALVDITGAIGPATARYVSTALATARERRAEVIILQLNTPGGLATSMREIIADVLASPVPVVGFVAPSGAHAASAGTYILYATHIAAMAPGTNLGAATPVQIGGLPGLPSGREGNSDSDKDDKDQAKPAASQDPMAAKVTNDAVAFIRSLAELRGRNAEWAEEAVREAATLSAQAALDRHVIDLVSRTPEELLARIDGREVEVAGERRRLHTSGLPVEILEPGWLARLLAVITDPNIAFLLVIVGLFGLIFEFSNPGVIAPGVIGALCLVLGLYALNMLPVDYTGLALMVLGVAFLIAEAFTPTVVLGIGGLIAFVLGSAILIDTSQPEFQLSWTAIAAAAAGCFGLFTLTLSYVWRTRRRPVRTGAPAMLGQRAEVLDWSGDAGHVLTHGERWQARGGKALARGDCVEVTGIDGLTLVVRRSSGTANRPGETP